MRERGEPACPRELYRLDPSDLLRLSGRRAPRRSGRPPVRDARADVSKRLLLLSRRALADEDAGRPGMRPATERSNHGRTAVAIGNALQLLPAHECARRTAGDHTLATVSAICGRIRRSCALWPASG